MLKRSLHNPQTPPQDHYYDETKPARLRYDASWENLKVFLGIITWKESKVEIWCK